VPLQGDATMEQWLSTLIREEQQAGFPDLGGAEARLTLPVSDRLISRVIAKRLPPTAPIADVEVFAESGNQFKVRVRLKKPSFLPPITVAFLIERQPELPASPVLVLRLLSEGIAALAGPALRLFDVLPPGIRFDSGRVFVDLAAIASQRGMADALQFVQSLSVTTETGKIIVAAALAVRRV
jgi:hypothetical protein